MKITAKTLYRDFVATERIARKSDLQRLKDVAEKSVHLYWALPLEKFLAVCRGDVSAVGIDPTAELTVINKYWLDGFRDFVETFAQACKAFTPPQTADARRAEQSCKPYTVDEGLYVFCQRFFGLPSFTAADSITMREIYIAKKATYNDVVSQMAMAAAMKARSKAH
jgi:hypothetical protein